MLMYASNYGNHVIVERILNYLSDDHEAIIELATRLRIDLMVAMR